MISHYIVPLTQFRNGQQLTACGVYIKPALHSCEPSCPECKAWLERDTADFESMLAWSLEQDAIKAGAK